MEKMVVNSKTKPIEALSANVLDTRFEDFDHATIENAKNRIIDVLGCVIGGARAEGNGELVNLIRDWGGKEEATILVHGGKAPAHNVAMMNSIMARSFDYEALGPLVEGKSIPAHISGTTVVTAITMGEVFGIDGKELLTALLVGDDVSARVLAASGFGGLPLGWDNVGTVNMFGSAAIAGRLLGLNRYQMRNAFGLALNQMAGTMQNIWDGTPAFKLLQGLSARNGIFSAQIAKTGWTGPDDPLLSTFGYYSLYTQGCANPEILTKDLGRKYYTDAHFKPYPCCAVSHPAIDCALAIVYEHDIEAGDIEGVILSVSQAGLDSFLAQPFRIGAFPHASAIFNYRYHVATALQRKKIHPGHFSEESIRDPEVKALADKIVLALLPGAENELLRARLKVRMKDGREFEKSTESPKGEPLHNPLSKDEIIDKFKANVAYSRTVTGENAEKVLALLEEVEEVSNVKDIIALLIAGQ